MVKSRCRHGCCHRFPQTLIDKGDIIIDGGNTFFRDTIRRNRELSAEGFNFIGTGVSGGEEGALKGRFHYARWAEEAYDWLRQSLTKIAAVAEEMVSRALPILVRWRGPLC